MEDSILVLGAFIQVFKMYWPVIPISVVLCMYVNKLSKEDLYDKERN